MNLDKLRLLKQSDLERFMLASSLSAGGVVMLRQMHPGNIALLNSTWILLIRRLNMSVRLISPTHFYARGENDN